MWIERLTLLGALMALIVYGPVVHGFVDHPILAIVLAYVAFPLMLLALVELVGRAIQSLHASKL